MSGVDELVAFLRARLDDDERAARAWLPFGNPTTADREHIARHDPVRVLAEVEAKRSRVDWIEGELADDETNETAQWLAKLEAQPYAGRPGWREEWSA